MMYRICYQIIVASRKISLSKRGVESKANEVENFFVVCKIYNYQ